MYSTKQLYCTKYETIRDRIHRVQNPRTRHQCQMTVPTNHIATHKCDHYNTLK